jgi:hypothetical protein
MRQPWLIVAATILTTCVSFGARAGETPKFQSYVLVVAGDGKEDSFTENYRDWIGRLHKLLTADCGIPAANVRVLAEKKDLVAQVVNDVSLKANVLSALKDFQEKVKPGDQFVLVYLGHGTVQNKTAKLCLPGPDISSEETAEYLSRIRTREIVFLHTAAGSDGFIEKNSLPGRVIIAATSNPAEGNETYFLEFFLKAYENKTADQNKNGTVELLEAFNWAATECPKWYLRQYMTKEDGWRIEGKQSRQLWEKFYGKVADKRMAPVTNPDANDAEPQLGDWGPQWEGRRMPSEHAALDDNGDRQGTMVYVNDRFTAISGSEEGTDGWHAKKIVLGKPAGNTELPPPPAPPAEPKP